MSSGIVGGGIRGRKCIGFRCQHNRKRAITMLPQVGVADHTQVSMVNDTSHGEDGVYFNTTNEDRVQTSFVPMIDVNDVISLPKGQAFVLVNGGEVWKVRIPLSC